MHIDQHTKITQKMYCKVALAEHGQLTRELVEKIDAGDEDTMRAAYIAQQQRIWKQAESMEDPSNKQITLTQIDSIQEVLDSLREILNA